MSGPQADPGDGASHAEPAMPADTEPPTPAEGPTSEHATAPAEASSIKILKLRRGDRCACGAVLEVGDHAGWDRTTQKVICLACLAAPIEAPAPAPDATPEPPALPAYDAVRAWQFEMTGDRRLASTLASLGHAVLTLDERRVPDSDTIIDHVVIGPAGVYVIEAKLYRDPQISMHRTGGGLRPTESQLMVDGKDCTDQATAMDKQVNAVRAALELCEDFQYVPVMPVLCFVDGQFAIFGSIEIGRVRVRGLGGTANLVATDGPFDEDGRARIQRHLAEQLPGRFDTH